MRCDYEDKYPLGSCGETYDSVGFSDDMYYVFCKNHIEDAHVDVIKYLYDNPMVSIEGEFPKEWVIHPTRIKPERTQQ